MPFPVSCPACGKSFSIADDAYEQKIKGRVVSVKCKQCQTLIRVDGTREPNAAAGSSNAPANPGLTFLVDTPGATDRELTGAQIAAEMLAGRMTEATLVWREGMEEWTEAGKVKELASFLMAPAPATESARAPRIRPMQPTLPMGMMAPPSLAARGLGLPLTSPVPARGEDSEASKLSADDGRELVGDSLPQLDSMPPEPDREPPAPARPASAEDLSPARPASTPGAALPKPASAPRAAAAPIPTPMPRPARGSSPLTSAAPIGVAEEPSHPGTYPMKPAVPLHSAFPDQRQPLTASSAPTAPAPPGAMPQQSLAPLPPNAVPSLPSSMPAPLPASFPATASIESLDFRPKRKRTIVVAVLIGIAVIGIALVAASGGGAPAPIPVPVPPVPTAEPPTPSPTPTPSPPPASNSPTGNPGADPLKSPTAPPRPGNEFTDLFAAGAKKLGSAKPATSATPPPTQ